LLVVMGRQ